MFGCFKIIRWGLGSILSLILGAIVIISIVLASVAMLITDSSNVKRWLDQGGVYATVDDVIIEIFNENLDKNGMEMNKFIEGIDVHEVFQVVFDEAWIKQKAEIAIDAGYAWFQGESEQPRIEIDLRERQEVLEAEVMRVYTDKLNSLPECTGGEAVNEQNFDLFSSSCKPAGIEESMIEEKVTESFKGEDMLGHFSLMPEDISLSAEVTEKVQYIFSVLENLPQITMIVILIASLIVLIIIPGWKNGVLITGIMWVVASGIVLVSSVSSRVRIEDLIFDKIQQLPATEGQLNQIVTIIQAPLDLIITDVMKQASQVAIIIIVIGVVLVFGGIVAKKRTKTYYIKEDDISSDNDRSKEKSVDQS